MNTKDRIIIEITPETGLKLAPGEKFLKHIPEDCQYACGLPRKSAKQPMVVVATMKKKFPDMYKALGGKDYKPKNPKKEMRYGCPHCLSVEGLRKKKRIERLFRYREKLAFLVKLSGFVLPVCGWSLYFYFPIPKQWPKKKREKYDGQIHSAKPDLDNIEKNFYDSLSKTDETIGQLSGHGKFWVDRLFIDENGQKNKGEGYIEILLNQPVYNPFNKTLLPPELLKEPKKEGPKRVWTKRTAGDPLKRKVKPLKIRKDLIK